MSFVSRFAPLSLRGIMLGFITLATLSLTVPGLVWLIHGRGQQERQGLELQATRLTTGATPLLLNALVVGDLATAEQILIQLNNDGFFSHLRLLEADGKGVVIDVSPAAHAENAAPVWFRYLLGREEVTLSLPVQSGGQRYAVLFAQPDLHGPLHDLWGEFRYLSLGVLALNVILALMVGIILSRGLRPIHQLGKAAERLGRGEMWARMQEASPPELQPTIQAFNSMADNIEKLMGEVREQAMLHRKLAAIVSQSDEAILSLDNACRITSWNIGAEQLLGFSTEEMLGYPVSELLLSPVLSPEHEVESMLASRPPNLWETHLRRKNGSDVAVAVSASPLVDDAAHLVGHILMARDISHIKAAQSALLHAKEAAETASRMKSEFLANMSHEIRTPMNGIIGMTDLALDTPLNDEQREYMSLVKSSADALLSVINDILDFSKIEAGRLDMETLPFKLRVVICDTVKSQAIRLREKPVELLFEIAPDVPEILLGDPGRLRQVLLNLLGNAIKFTERGEISVHVDCAAAVNEADEIVIRITVRDSGIGIPEHKLAGIFDAFTQVDSSITRRFGGTGLGLTITRRLIELMQGTIQVQSREGEGSVFSFTARFTLARNQENVVQRNLGGMRVLIVDDNTTNRRILKDALERAQVCTETAASGEACFQQLAVAQAANQPFDAVLLDVQMPEMDGFSVAARIRDNPAFASLRIIMLSSVGMRGDAAYCRSLGLSAYLTKPIYSLELLDALRMVMTHAPSGEDEIAVVTRHSLHEFSVQAHAVAEAASPSEQRGHTLPLRVLLVEDNAINQRLACALLAKEGHAVSTAENGMLALEKIAEEAFDLVLMDVQMPVMDGFEATRHIRAMEQADSVAHPHLIVVAMTANAFPEDRAHCLDVGMDDYLSKPLQLAELKRVLDFVSRARQVIL